MFETDPNMGADLARREMSVREFLESATAVGELVVVTCGGWPTCTVHIDSEDYFGSVRPELTCCTFSS